MRKSRYRVKTTYFLVTTNGNLRKISPTLVVTLVALVLSAVVFVGGKCAVYNQQLTAERIQIQTELTRMEYRHNQIEQDLAVCDANKKKIDGLLYSNTAAENTSDEK